MTHHESSSPGQRAPIGPGVPLDGSYHVSAFDTDHLLLTPVDLAQLLAGATVTAGASLQVHYTNAVGLNRQAQAVELSKDRGILATLRDMYRDEHSETPSEHLRNALQMLQLLRVAIVAKAIQGPETALTHAMEEVALDVATIMERIARALRVIEHPTPAPVPTSKDPAQLDAIGRPLANEVQYADFSGAGAALQICNNCGAYAHAHPIEFTRDGRRLVCILPPNHSFR